MAENTGIEWADHTFNPWIGCTKVGPGCDHCYAEARMDSRLHRVQWGAGQPRQRTKTWGDPVRWNKQHDAFFAEHGRRQRVFCASLADVFDNEVPPAWRAELFALIDRTPHLDWLLLTKRVGNVVAMLDQVSVDLALRQTGAPWPPRPNVWLGATVVNQAEADRDVPKLLAVPARVRFLSIEPMLGPINLADMEADGGDAYVDPLTAWSAFEMTAMWGEPMPAHPRIDWVICGGESGPSARPMHPDWARSLRDQCAAAGVPFLFKQWGEWLPWAHFGDAGVEDGDGQQPTRFDTREWRDGAWLDVGHPDFWASMDGEIDDDQCMGRVGKKAAGRQLDGRTHDEFPS